MDKRKKLLIISASAGSGHIRAAEAILKTAQQKFQNLEAKHIVFSDYLTPSTRRIFFDSYDNLAKIQWLWNFFYFYTNTNTGDRIFKYISRLLSKNHANAFYKYLSNYKPDLILCTHFTAPYIISTNPQNNLQNIPIGTVITDYKFHKMWITSKEHHYFVPTPKIQKQLQEHEIPPENITVSGIPIDPVFYRDKNVPLLKDKYKISKTEPIILILPGAHGRYTTKQIVQKLFNLQKPATIINITDKENPLEKEIKKLKPPNHIQLKLISRTEKIDEYMRVADIVISKTGGLTTTECIALKKPIITINPTIRQEKANAKYIAKHEKLGSIIYKIKNLLPTVEEILNTKKLNDQKLPQKNNKKSATDIILERIFSSSQL